MVLNQIFSLIQIGLIFLLIIVFTISVWYLIRFFNELKKASNRFDQTKANVDIMTSKVILMKQQIDEIENTPIFNPSLQRKTAKVLQYGKSIRSVIRTPKKHKQKRNNKALRVQRKVSKRYGK